MIGNLAAILISEEFPYNFKDDISTLLEVMKKSENKEVLKNGVRALKFFFKKLDLNFILNQKLFDETLEFIKDVILFDNDFENLMNSLTVFEVIIALHNRVDEELFKRKGFLAKLDSLVRLF